MSLTLSLLLPVVVVGLALLIGASTEFRFIVHRRATLVDQCAATGFDPRLAFEIADVERDGVERRLFKASLQGVIALIVAMFPARLATRPLAEALEWTESTRLWVATFIPLVGPLVWSGLKVRSLTTDR